MRSRTVVRSLISGHTTVVAHDDGSINLRLVGHRERRVTVGAVPSVLLTMTDRQGRDLLLVGDALGRLHVVPMDCATVTSRIDLASGRIRALAASPTERGDVVVATSNGTVAVVDLNESTHVNIARFDGPVGSLQVSEEALIATVRSTHVTLNWDGDTLSEHVPVRPTSRRYPRRRSTLVVGPDQRLIAPM
ncbi:MAG TPA: hypothetical protein HA276_05285 [Candidatus Poseidoniaceae archaeon]|nr:MAG: hypothetical protein CBD01_004510 [Euryarchaeota archaeon TMED141]DAC16682.1 MAG TPA: hypothetical protein D7I01_05195 [Candidatus Poseidoniales archaeon]HII97086.1 hypothetical protein [Candidatus Poseidoniaceae archaeon]